MLRNSRLSLGLLLVTCLSGATAGAGAGEYQLLERLSAAAVQSFCENAAPPVLEGSLTLSGVAVRLAGIDFTRLPLLEELGEMAKAVDKIDSGVREAPAGLILGRFSFPWLTVAAYVLGAGLLAAGVACSLALYRMTTPRRKRRYVQ